MKTSTKSLYIMRSKVGRNGPRAKLPRTRAVTGSEFRETRLCCMLSIADAASVLHVTERTVQNWEAGRVRVPYAAFKLLRILRGYDLPGEAWQGYRLVGDTLWSPEGLAFKAADQRWWSLTCLMARQFRAMVAERHSQDSLTGGPGGASRPAPAPQALGLSLSPTWDKKVGGNGPEVRSDLSPSLADFGAGLRLGVGLLLPADTSVQVEVTP